MTEFNNFNVNFNEQPTEETYSESVSSETAESSVYSKNDSGAKKPYAPEFNPETLKEKANIKNEVYSSLIIPI
jgi:hypothetical protein